MKTIQPVFTDGAATAPRKGFTLTELVVVLATIALLIAVCLPVLAATKNQTKIAQCAGNLKQFTLAMHIYGGENNDKLPVLSGGPVWAWDLPWSVGNVITQWVSWRQLYCPGTGPRFDETDNLYLWNCQYIVGQAPYTMHILGYAFAFSGPGCSLTPANQNTTLLSEPIRLTTLPGGPTLPAPSPAQRVLLADATISLNLTTYANRYKDVYNSVPGGYTPPPAYAVKSHTSPHLNGIFPAGGNAGFKDGHVQWRKFDNMDQRAATGRGFWW